MEPEQNSVKGFLELRYQVVLYRNPEDPEFPLTAANAVIRSLGVTRVDAENTIAKLPIQYDVPVEISDGFEVGDRV